MPIPTPRQPTALTRIPTPATPAPVPTHPTPPHTPPLQAPTLAIIPLLWRPCKARQDAQRSPQTPSPSTCTTTATTTRARTRTRTRQPSRHTHHPHLRHSHPHRPRCHSPSHPPRLCYPSHPSFPRVMRVVHRTSITSSANCWLWSLGPMGPDEGDRGGVGRGWGGAQEGQLAAFIGEERRVQERRGVRGAITGGEREREMSGWVGESRATVAHPTVAVNPTHTLPYAHAPSQPSHTPSHTHTHTIPT